MSFLRKDTTHASLNVCSNSETDENFPLIGGLDQMLAIKSTQFRVLLEGTLGQGRVLSILLPHFC